MTSEAPATMSDTLEATAFQCDLYRYWRAVQTAGGIAVGRRGYLTRSALRAVRERLDQPADASGERERAGELSDMRRFFLRRLLERLSLLEQDSEQRLVAAPQATMQRYVSLPLAARVRLCARLWLAGAWWVDRPDERQDLPGVRVPAPPRIALARRRALQTLLDASPGNLLALPSPQSTYPALSRSTPVAATNLLAPRNATPGDDAVCAAALLGPLTWLGLLAPIAPEPGGAMNRTARVTGAVAAVHSLDPDAPLPALCEASGRIIAQPNFEIVALPPLAAPTLLTLDSCADLRGAGSAAAYILTREACARARRAGWQSGAIITQLERLVGTPLPQNVRVTLADWDRQAERLRVRRDIAVLQVRDPRVLDRMVADAQAVGWVERRVAPTVALLRADSAGAVRTWLLRHGELPALRPTLDETERAADEAREGKQPRPTA